jgi:hypothetical protein
VGRTTLTEALFIAHIILNIVILVIIVIVEAKLSATTEYLYRIFNRVYFAAHVLERVEKKIDELDKKVAG